jgi:hypothetical protein
MAAAALGDASDTMICPPLALQPRDLQSLVEIAVDKNSTVVFPAPLMSTIGERCTFLARETAAGPPTPRTVDGGPPHRLFSVRSTWRRPPRSGPGSSLTPGRLPDRRRERAP